MDIKEGREGPKQDGGTNWKKGWEIFGIGRYIIEKNGDESVRQ